MYLPLSNPERGCGRRVPGGFYLESTSSPGGTLNPVTYWFSDQCADLFPCDIPHRGQVFGAPVSSLLSRAFVPAVTENIKKHTDYAQFWHRIHSRVELPGTDNALFDHVGVKHYPNWMGFIKEGLEFGFSRRVKSDMAKLVANMLPIPLIFVTTLPRFSNAQIEVMKERWSFCSYKSTWANNEWACHIQDKSHQYHGDDHFMFHLGMVLLNDVEDNQFGQKMMEQQLSDEQQVFASTWITRVVYCKSQTDTDEKMLELVGQGIEVGVLE